MFKRIVLLTMAILMCLPLWAWAEENGNLLKNPGFEILGTNGLPADWTSDAYLTREGISLFGSSEDAHTGAYAATVENLDMNDARFAQTVTVKPNTMYRLSGWIKADDILDAGRGANLSIGGVYVFSESLYDTEGEWAYLETYGLTDSDQTEVTVFVRVGGYSGESKGAATFDDVCLEAVETLPEGVFAEAWFVRQTVQAVEPAQSNNNTGVAAPFWPWLLVIAAAYAGACFWLMRHLQSDRREEALREAGCCAKKRFQTMPAFAMLGLAIAVFARLLTALNVDGYQVDVNCFTAWGNTMVKVGPANFYQSNWCDYTPGYIYIMGLNGLVAQKLGGIVSAAFVHKLIPIFCDVLGAALLYNLAVEHQYTRRQAGFLAVMFAFNPATFLNSAAWCQVDSVLCIGLMLVAYFAIHRKWIVVLPLYVFCILVKPQALMLGFLGLAAIVMEVVHHYRDKKLWLQIGLGLLISIAVALVVILPFNSNQEGGWLIDLYGKTLSSYAYATVNTANLYFLAGANWQGIEHGAADGVCFFLAFVAATWAGYTFLHRKDRRLTIIEPLLTICSTLLVLVCALLCMSWLDVAKASTDANWLTLIRLTLADSYRLTILESSISILGAHLLIAAGGLAVSIAAMIVFLVRKKRLCLGLCEPVMMLLLSATFLFIPLLSYASWTEVGVAAMAMVFVIVLPIYMRSGKLENLPLCGAVIFILLYVFGIKMHERYLFPAIFLLGMAYAIKRDRRTLGLLIGTTCVLFVNEGVILDNSLRLGSSMGHLNADNTDLGMVLSVLNVIFALLATWTCHSICLNIGPQDALKQPQECKASPAQQFEEHPCTPLSFKASAKMSLTRKDALLMLVVTAIYSIVTLTTLGSTKAPQNPWKSSAYDEYVYLDLGQHYDDFSMMYFCQVSYNNFAIAVSDDSAETAWTEEYPAQMAEGMCFSWQYLDPSYVKSDGKVEFVNASEFGSVQKLSGRYVRLNAKQVGLTINELIFKDAAGNIIPGVTVMGRENANDASPYYSDPANLLDEQNTLDGEPSWWNSTYFDEIYHARTAFEHKNGTHAYEWTHPPLGKIIMSWFVAIFGMTPFGWRFGGALCGILMLPAMYLLVKQLTKRTDMAFVAMMLMTLDCMHFTQTRIATIDSYPVLFIMLSYLFMLRFMQRDIVLEDIKKVLPDLALCGFFMGCGVASKWIGVYAGIGLAVLYFWTSIRHLRLARMASEQLSDKKAEGFAAEEKKLLSARSQQTFKRVVILCFWCLLFFVAVPVVIYLLTYVVHFADRSFNSLGEFLTTVYNTNFGKEYSMLSYHGTPGLGMDHYFYSPWYEWPLMMTPMYYASAAFKPEGLSYAIFCFGNPWVWVVGLAGIAYTVYRWIKGHCYSLQGHEGMLRILRKDWDVTPAFVLIGLLAQFLPWVLVPRGTYIYHYFASIPFLIIGTTLLIHHITQRWPVAGRRIWIGYLILCLIWFIVLFPYASGIPVSEAWLDFIRDYPFISKINNYWQDDFLVKLNTFLEKIPILPHVYHH